MLLMALTTIAVTTACTQKPTDGQTAIAKWKDLNDGNYHTDGQLNMRILVTAGKTGTPKNIGVNIPVETSFDMTSDGSNAEGRTSMSAGMLEKRENSTVLFFYDQANETLYTAAQPGTTWTKQQPQNPPVNILKLVEPNQPEQFKSAFLEFSESDKTYRVNTKIGDILTEDEIRKTFLVNGAISSDILTVMDNQAFMDMLKNADIVYTFSDNDNRLLKVQVQGSASKTRVAQGDYELDVKLEVSADIALTEHRNIETIEIPLEVSETAVTPEQ